MAKLKGTTIIETIVAILIISVCFEIGILSISRILYSNQGLNKINADFIAEKELNNINIKKEFIDYEYEFNNFHITRKISDYKETSNLKLLEIKVSVNNKILLKKKRLILINENK